jgi:hypothetical protein
MANPQNYHTVDTSPDALGLTDFLSSSQQDASSTQSRVKRMSNVVGQTVDRLSRSISGKSGRTSPSTTTTPPPISGHRRLFSLTRKGKALPDSSGDNCKHFLSTNLATSPDMEDICMISQR